MVQHKAKLVQVIKAGDVIDELNKLKNVSKAALLKRYFKTGKGEYGENDIFLGITVPQQRRVAIQYKDISVRELSKLLKSKIHEHRFTALEILVAKYDSIEKVSDASVVKGESVKDIIDFYLSHIACINNWDLVDTSAAYILGRYLFTDLESRSVLYKLAVSKNIWERRISIVSTHYFISRGEFSDAVAISTILLHDSHDLIHKAVGWTLRELGKKSEPSLEQFLQQHARQMPRIMLRYSVERLSKEKRAIYMKK